MLCNNTYQQNAKIYQNTSQSIESRTNNDNVTAPETWHIVAVKMCQGEKETNTMEQNRLNS